MDGGGHAMKLNDRARKAVADDLQAGEQLLAIVQLVTRNKVKHSTQTGNVLGGSVLGQPYFVDRQLNMDHPSSLPLLHDAWMTVTDRRLLFHKANPMAIRPKPGDLIHETTLGTSVLRWWNQDAIWRVIHLEFDDGMWLGQAIGRGAGASMKKPLAEADLLVQAWGDRAIEVPEPER